MTDDKNVKEENEKVETSPTEEVKEEAVAETIAVEEVKAEEPAVEAKAEVKEEPKEEPKAVEKPSDAPATAGKPAEAKPVGKPTKELAGKLAKLATEIEGLTVLEMADLASYLEEKFGVTAMAMGGSAQPASASADATADKEEKSTYNVVLTDAGANKLGAIKAVREIMPNLGLMDAKKLVESAPKPVAEGVKKDEAEAAVKKLTEAGAKAELQ